MKLTISDELSDTKRLSYFFSQFTNPGLIDFKLDRGEHFFSPYALESSQYRTYLLSDDSNELMGLASFVIKKVLIGGLEKNIAIGKDLRISNFRKARLHWGEYFVPVLEELKKDFLVDYFFSVINPADTAAVNTFVRPGITRRILPRYYLYRKFDLVSVHGLLPWSNKPIQSIYVKNASEKDKPALYDYIIQKSLKKNFSQSWNLEQLEKKISLLKGLKLENFLIATDYKNNIVGCLALYKPENFQKNIPLRYSLKAHNFRQSLKVLNLFGLAKKLTKPVSSTGFENALNYQFLSFIFVDNADIFENLLWHAHHFEKQDFFIYARSDRDIKLLPPDHWITAQIPQSLYAMLLPNDPVPDFLHPSEYLIPEIESCFAF